ncbi:NUDIX hydrolase [Candidatus Frankia nodulisporulans]|uniref:NUDIX hydrolase n=1 Tax=Candidatus Frankia nodulisporulans TaxID=2060052 RepID=UPI001581E24C|nr:NUDIX hydrolase [Candidatus Frankia nodulisporulans]
MPPSRSAPGRTRLRRVEETSAGGLILDQRSANAYAALIGRLDRSGRMLWSLPKGHIEAGETAEQAAVREVGEETGLTGRILGRLGTIDFWFVAGGARIHKTVHHFLLVHLFGSLSDTDVEVDAVTWVPLIEVADRLAYADERRLLDEVPIVLAATA